MSKQNNSTKSETVTVSKAIQDSANEAAARFYEAYVQAPEGSAGDLEARAAEAENTITSYMLAVAKAARSDADKFVTAIGQAEQTILKDQHGIKYPSKEVPHWKQTKSNIKAGLVGIEFPDGETRRLKAGDFATMYEFRKALGELRKAAKKANEAEKADEKAENTGEESENNTPEIEPVLRDRLAKLQRFCHDASGNAAAVDMLQATLDNALEAAKEAFEELTAEALEREQENRKAS